MAAMELSRWPSLKVEEGPPENALDVFIIDPADIPADVKKIAKDCAQNLENKPGNLSVSRSENRIKIFVFINTKSTSAQRGLLNKLLDKFKSLTREGCSFASCNLRIKTPSFRIEALESFMLSLYEFSRFQVEANQIKNIFLTGDFSDAENAKIAQLANILSWVYFTQDLVNYPPSLKPPVVLAETIRGQLIDIPNINISEWRKSGKNNYFEPVWAVGKASQNEPVIMRIEYSPEKPVNEKPLTIIGKGVCFDAGGMNAKTDDTLAEMKLDMAGGAATAGVVGYVASRQWPIHLIAYIPMVENLFGSMSIKTSDMVSVPIVKEPQDKKDFEYIEVVDTDAEGRLLLSSVVSYSALHDDPELIVTIATLCGSTEGMLGSYMAAAISTGKKLLEDIQAAGIVTDENYSSVRVSSDILDECQSDMEGEISDWKNYNSDIANGDSLMAFSLIQNFAGNTPLLHLDICGVAWLKWNIVYRSKKRRLSGATGWGVRSVSEFLKRRFNIA